MGNIISELYTKHLNKKVEEYWNIYHFDMEPGHRSYNNEGDAFKHCYWQAEMTLFFCRWIANWMGIKHEDDNPLNNRAEREMDLHNNAVGREIGISIKKKWFFWFFHNWDDAVAEEIMHAMYAGDLITKPREDKADGNNR